MARDEMIHELDGDLFILSGLTAINLYGIIFSVVNTRQFETILSINKTTEQGQMSIKASAERGMPAAADRKRRARS